MLKVLYLLNHAGKAGTERYVQSLIEKLNGKRIKAYFAYNEDGLLVERLKTLGIETFRLEMKNPYDIKAAMKLGSLCKKLDIHLIHTQYLRENYIALLSRLFYPKVKVVYTNHFILRNNNVLRASNRIMTRLQSSIIAVCNKGKDMLVYNGNDAKKIKVIFNGVDPDVWGEPGDSTLRSEFNIDSDTFVLLCASRFAHDKGHRFLINSMAELHKLTDRKFKLVLAGDGPLQDEIRQQVKDLGIGDKVIFTGFRKDIKNLIDGSDLYINSSEHEALSFLIIEVLAAGLPVIVSDMGGNRDIINSETNCGLLVEYNNASALAHAVLKIMGDRVLYLNFRQNALKAVQEKFNLDKIVDQTYNLYVASCNGK